MVHGTRLGGYNPLRKREEKKKIREGYISFRNGNICSIIQISFNGSKFAFAGENLVGSRFCITAIKVKPHLYIVHQPPPASLYLSIYCSGYTCSTKIVSAIHKYRPCTIHVKFVVSFSCFFIACWCFPAGRDVSVTRCTDNQAKHEADTHTHSHKITNNK